MISTASWNALAKTSFTYNILWETVVEPSIFQPQPPCNNCHPHQEHFLPILSLPGFWRASLGTAKPQLFFFWFSDPLSTQSCHFLLVQLILLFILQTCMFTYLLISPLYYSNINLWLILHLFPKGGNFQRGLGKLMTPLLSRAVWVIGFIALAIKWNQAKCMCPYAYRSFG